MKYTTPEVELKVLETKDVIAASVTKPDDDNNNNGGTNNGNNEFETPWDN